MSEGATTKMEPNFENHGKLTNMTVFKDRTKGYLLKVNPVRIPNRGRTRADFSKYDIPLSQVQAQMLQPPCPVSAQQSNMASSLRSGMFQNVLPSNMPSNQLSQSQNVHLSNMGSSNRLGMSQSLQQSNMASSLQLDMSQNVQPSNMTSANQLGMSQNVQQSDMVSSNQLGMSQNTREASYSVAPSHTASWTTNSQTYVNSNFGSTVHMSTLQNPNSVQSSVVQSRSNYPCLAAEQYNAGNFESQLTNSNIVMSSKFVSSGNQNYVTPTTAVQGTDHLPPETTDYLLLDLDQTTSHSSQEATLVEQTPVTIVPTDYQPPVTMVSSGFQPPITMVSSGFQPPVTMVSSGYQAPVTMVSSEYSPALTMASSIYQPSVTMASSMYQPSVTMASSIYQPSVTMASSIYNQQPSTAMISKGYQQIASTGNHHQGNGTMTAAEGDQQQNISRLPAPTGAPHSSEQPEAQLSLMSTVNSKLIHTKVCQNTPVVQTVTQVKTNSQTIQFKEACKSRPQIARSPSSEITVPYCDCQVKDYTADWMNAVSFTNRGHDSFLTSASSVIINKKQVFTFSKNKKRFVSVGELRFKNILPKAFRYLSKAPDDVLTLEDKEIEFLVQKNALINRKIKRCISLEHLRALLKTSEPWYELTLGHYCPKVALLSETSVFVCPICRHVEPPQDGDGIHVGKCSNCSYLKRNQQVKMPGALCQNIQDDGVPIGYIDVAGKKICAYKYQGQSFVSCSHLINFLSGFPWNNFVNLAESLKVNFVAAPMSVVIRFLQHYPSEVVGEGYWCTLSQLRCIACFSVGQMNNTTFLARNQILPLIAQGQYTEVFHEKPQQNPVEQSDEIQLQQFRKQVVYVTPYTKMPAGRYVVDEQEHFIDILREDGTVYRLCKKGKVSLNEQKSDVKMNDILSIAAKEIMTNVAEDSETLQDRNVNPNTNISSNVSLDAQGSSENGHVNAERNQMTDSVEPVQTPNSPPQTPSRVSSQIQQSTHQKQNSEQYSTLSKEPELLSMPNGFFESVPQVTKQKKHFLSTSKVGKPPIKAKETNPDVIVIQNECGATYECTPLGLVEELEKHGYCFSSNSPEKKQQVSAPQESSQQSVSRPTSTCPSLDSGISEGMELAPSAGYSEPTLTAEESQTALAIEAHADFLVQNSQEDIDKQDQGQSTPDAVEKQVFLLDQNRETSVQKDLDKMNEKSGFEQDNSLSTSEKFSGESSMAENPETFPPGDGTIHSPDTSLSFQGIPSPNSEVSTELKGGKEKTDNLSILASVAEEASPFSVETEVDESVETACSEMNSENEPLSRAAVEIAKSKQVGSSVTATVISVSDSVIVEPVNQFETEKFEHFERNMDCSNELQSEKPTSGYLQEQSLEKVKTNVESVSLPVQEAPCREITNDHEIENLEELRSICVELDQPKVQTALPLEKDLESEEAVRSSMDKPREILDESVHQEKLSAAGEAVRSIMDKPNKIPDMVVDQENLSATEGAAGTLPDHDLSLSASDDELPKMDSVNRNVKVSPDVMKKAWIKLTMDLSEHSSDEETELKANHETLGKAYSVEKNICYEPVPTGCDNVLEGTENVETYSPNANILPQREVSLTENFAMKSQTSPIRKSSIEGIPRPEKTEDVKQRDKESENFDQLSLKLQNMITKQKENNVKRNVELKVTSIEDSLVDSDSDNSEHKTCAEKDESKAEVTVPSIEDSFVDLDIDNSKHKRCKKNGGSKRKRKKKTKDVKRKTSCQTKISSIKLMIHKGRCVSMVGKNSKTEPRDSETSPSEHDETLCRADQNQNPDMKSDITEQTSKKHHKTKKRKQGCSVDQFSKKQKISEDLLEKPLEVDLNMKLPESKEHVLDVSKTKKGSAIAEEQLQNSKDSQKSETEPLISGNRNDIETMDSENTSEVVRITELTETNVHDQTGSIKSKPIGLTAAGNDFDTAEASNGPLEVDFTSGRPEHALSQNTEDHYNEMGSEIDTSSSGNTRLSEIAVTRDFTGSANERTVRTRDNAIEMTVTFDSLNTGHERSEGSKIIHERTTGISSWEGVKQSTNEMIGGTGTVKQHQEMKTSGRLESSESTTEGLQDLVEGDSSKAEGDSEKKWWTNLAPIHRMKGILERVVIQGVKESGGHLDLQLQVDPSIYQVFGEDEEKKRSLNDKLHQLSRIAYLQRRPKLISKQGNASQGTPNVNNQKPCCSKGQQPLFSAQEGNRIPCFGSSLDKINAVETDNSKSSSSSSVVKDTVGSSKKSKDSSTKSKAKDQSHSKKLKLNSCSSPSRKISLRPLHAESTSGSMDTTDKNCDYQTIKVTVLYDSDSSLKS